MLPSIISQDFIPFQFENIRFQEVCFINGNPYFTAKAIGEFLEYSQPQQAIEKIVERNPYIKPYRTAVQLIKSERKKKDHIFDFIGLQLIVNHSNKPKALTFKLAIANFLQKKNALQNIVAYNKESRLKQIVSSPASDKRSELIKDMATRENISLTTAYKWIDKFGELKTRKGFKRQNSRIGTTKYPELKEAAQFVRAQMPTYGPKRIAVAIGRPDFFENIKRWLKAA
jgi:prophage antirepressor-like protein